MGLPGVGVRAFGLGHAALAVRLQTTVLGDLVQMARTGQSEQTDDGRDQLPGHWNRLQAWSQKRAQVSGCALPGRQLRR